MSDIGACMSDQALTTQETHVRGRVMECKLRVCSGSLTGSQCYQVNSIYSRSVCVCVISMI